MVKERKDLLKKRLHYKMHYVQGQHVVLPLWELSTRGSQIIVETTESVVGAIYELGEGRAVGEGNAGSELGL